MLCTLMNIRSPSYYEFLRKNEILPLPCPKTVRDYFSLMASGCGFDENFFEILGKNFKNKDLFKRHGIICADEINLRRAIAVSSQNLTYQGITDYGDSRKETDISADNLATHGLVIMYQSLTENYSQPIATFALKNPVAGEELAKIMLKAICLLQKVGALIHGIIGDGASTNRKMQKTLGVQAKLEFTKSWFTHPLDNERQVFFFSDTPHLIKNVRNTLYNKGKLRIHPEKDCIQWNYFEELYNVDSQRIENSRVYPKLTKRHVQLDNTAKMRVRLSTQIIKESLEWLSEWENNQLKGLIHADEFLTKETAHGLRLTLTSTMDLCHYLIDKYDFKYLLTGKVNQDNLEVIICICMVFICLYL
ncbi:uncharacterized protein LOC117169483 isoform X2 [Belonocnema kinseyi]|uniref:uncharacterized protein LOC117169483 isoform X2 n=1 Tax=Belonocnema kinseyi TaxID=2817044 RepID=UPI00143DA350|nr:uncharacterized protein LOC117169483 isoform X2 [Belonocnema kinseyi]